LARRKGAKQVLEEYQHQSLRAKRGSVFHLFISTSLEVHVDCSDFEEFVFAVPGAISTRTFMLVLIRASIELLKAHRQDYMYQKYDMLQVPLMHDDVREKFSAQIMCSWVLSYLEFARN